ncbi:MAG TPA: hypothetical protein VNF47_21060 [Streptosporangiaceae bacterium]|nr:hypothetical protein [Streptosporangiaceae bacterium]
MLEDTRSVTAARAALDADVLPSAVSAAAVALIDQLAEQLACGT